MSRVVNGAGKGLQQVEGADMPRHPWIPETLVDAWREAGVGGAAACARAADLCVGLGWCQHLAKRLLPMPADRRAEFDRLLGQAKAELWARLSRTVALDAGSWWSRYEEATSLEVAERHFPEAVASCRWVGRPAPSWSTKPSGATLMSDRAAAEAAELLGKVAELGDLLPKAAAELKGASKAIREKAKLFKPIGGDWKSACGIEIQPFEPERQYDRARHYALYFAGPGGQEGFLTAQGGMSPDLAAARPFETEDLAMKTALEQERWSPSFVAHLVELEASVLGYRRARGPGSVEALDRALARREADELSRVLKDARIEALEAELARRRSLSGESEPERKPRGARL